VLRPHVDDHRLLFVRIIRQVAELGRLGLDDVATELDENLFAASIDPRLPTATRERVARLVDLGLPVAIFFAPPGTSL
jgi:hypothetical protein